MGNTNSIVSRLKRVSLSVAAMVVALSAFASPLVTAEGVAATSGTVSIESDVKVANVTAGDTSYSDSVNAKVDDVVKVQVWYHNKEDYNSGKIAQNLRVGINIPTAQGKAQTISSTVKADNSNTTNHSAQVNLSLDNAYLEYVDDSAKWRYNKGGKDGRTECQTGNQPVPANDPNNCYVTEKISDAVVKDENGLVLENANPCFAFEATVTVLMRVKASSVKVNKYVSAHDGDTDVKNNDWQTKNTAKPGDKMDYMIRFENTGNTVLNDVIVGDNLPDYMEYVSGSTLIINGNNPNGVASQTDVVFKGGINVGNYNPGAVGYVVFTVKINDKNVFEKCGDYTLKNVGVVRPIGMNETYNTAHTTVTIECDETPVTPAPTKPEQPKDEVPAEELPIEIPKTGPAALVGGLFGTSALGLGTHYWLASRRAYRNALNG